MLVLGIESTAHTFGVGIIKDKQILANEKDTYTTESGGIIPHESAKHHLRVAKKVIDSALEKAKIKIEDVDLISFSQGPGLDPCLIAGRDIAVDLAKKYNKPLIGVNHCIAHLEIGNALTGSKDPILLYASGANTQIIAYEAGKYRIFGETLDMGIGNMLDTFARELGIGFPGGPKIAELAAKGKNFIELPYCVKGMDVSFGGILTNLKQKLKKGFSKEDLCFSLQETVFAMLVEVAERAMAHTGKNELLLGGGVACNKRLQEMCRIMCEERNARFFCPENQVLVDNGAMIAYLGMIEYQAGVRSKNFNILPKWRTDQVEVTWK